MRLADPSGAEMLLIELRRVAVTLAVCYRPPSGDDAHAAAPGGDRPRPAARPHQHVVAPERSSLGMDQGRDSAHPEERQTAREDRVPTGHRPISLLSCVSKLCERLVNRRLVYLLESRQLLNSYQAGFPAPQIDG